jgi:polar amino acid transport system substrate-binding protein
MNCDIHGRSSYAMMVVVFVLWFAPFARAEDVITLLFTDRAPYTEMTQDGSPVGLVATEATYAFMTADLRYAWQVSSFKRILQTIEQPTGQNCAAGLYKTPERERFAKYTKPIFRDGQTVLIVRKEIAVPSSVKFEYILTIPNLRILVKGSYSYGAMIDGIFAKLKPNLIIADVEVRQMVEMLKGNRGDALIASAEEANYLMKELDRSGRTLKTVSLIDSPLGEYRYILCSKAVPDDVIERLNRTIRLK